MRHLTVFFLFGVACATASPPTPPPPETPPHEPVASPPPPASPAPTATPAAPAPAPAPPRDNTPAPRTLARGVGTPTDQALASGDDAYDRDDLAAAKKYYKKAQGLAQNDPAPAVGLARVELDESKVDIVFGIAAKDPRLVALLAKLDAARRLDQDYGPVELERGKVLFVLGRADEALEALRRAVLLRPNDVDAHAMLGVALISTGRSDLALESLRRVVELEPNSVEPLTNLGTAHL